MYRRICENCFGRETISFITIGLILFFTGSVSLAGTLPLPDTAKTIHAQIADQCADCMDTGFSPAGTAGIGFGKKFYSNFFMGEPSRGILVSHVMTAGHAVSVLRENDLESAKNILQKKFAGTRLFIVEKDGLRVHPVPVPISVEVNVPEQLHGCLHGSGKPLCCCCTDCSAECCEKKLGSASVTLRWSDPLDDNRTIVYNWYPHPGSSKIFTLNADGDRLEMRWCLDSDGAGFLK